MVAEKIGLQGGSQREKRKDNTQGSGIMEALRGFARSTIGVIAQRGYVYCEKMTTYPTLGRKVSFEYVPQTLAGLAYWGLKSARNKYLSTYLGMAVPYTFQRSLSYFLFLS